MNVRVKSLYLRDHSEVLRWNYSRCWVVFPSFVELSEHLNEQMGNDFKANENSKKQSEISFNWTSNLLDEQRINREVIGQTDNER